jgi:hypothetical protein
MDLPPEVKKLRDKFFEIMVEAVAPLQKGPDREVTLQALIAAAQMLSERLAQELEELRQEAD